MKSQMWLRDGQASQMASSRGQNAPKFLEWRREGLSEERKWCEVLWGIEQERGGARTSSLQNGYRCHPQKMALITFLVSPTLLFFPFIFLCYHLSTLTPSFSTHKPLLKLPYPSQKDTRETAVSIRAGKNTKIKRFAPQPPAPRSSPGGSKPEAGVTPLPCCPGASCAGRRAPG
jgi:hypothetical protein